MTPQQPKKNKAGRPRNPDRDAQQKARRFIPVEKNARTLALLQRAKRAHRMRTGRDGSDAEVIRSALELYGAIAPFATEEQIDQS